MMKFIPIPNKKVKEIKQVLEDTWGFTQELDYVFFMNERKIYIINPDIKEFDFEKIRINSLGLYLGELNDRNQLRLSIEGAQIIGKHAAKNILDINEEQAALWMKGEDLELESDIDNFVIIRCKDDFLGCGKPKEGKILNFVPKNRRVEFV